MARDANLERLVAQDLRSEKNLSQTKMFGGLAWLKNGHLVCAASDRGLLVRLGKGREAWALAHDGVDTMIMQGRPMEGWLRMQEKAFQDEALRRTLIEAALQYVKTLPPK